MDDVISVFSSPATSRDPPPRIDLEVIVITDSEPEEVDRNDLLWTELKKESATPNLSFHRHRGDSKEDSPMDVDIDIPATQAGPSTAILISEPFPEAPVIHIGSEADTRTMQDLDADLHSKHLTLILEVIPDVLPTHIAGLIKKLYPTHKDRVVERILQDLFDNPSYPKVEKASAGKSKRKAEELGDALGGHPSRVKIDFASVDRPKPPGKNYRKLALVSWSSINGPQSLRARLTICHAI
jgi:hypothetical protein